MLPLIEARLEAIAGKPAAIATDLNAWITPEPADMKSGISLYIAYTATGSLVANFGAIAQYGSGNGVSGGALYFQTRPPDTPGVQLRLDSFGGSTNIGVREESGRVAGLHVHSTVVSAGITQASCALDGGPIVTGAVPTPGTGIPRERLILTPTPSSGTAEIVPIFAIVYNTAHDLYTRRAIERHLMTLRKVNTFVPPIVGTTQPIFTRSGTGAQNFTPAQIPDRDGPVTMYGAWSAIAGSERVAVNANSWLALGRGGNGKLFAMRQQVSDTKIAYADPEIPEGSSMVASAVATPTRLSVMSLGGGSGPRSSQVTLTDRPFADPVSVSMSGTSPAMYIFKGEHTDAQRNIIMRAIAYRYGITIP